LLPSSVPTSIPTETPATIIPFAVETTVTPTPTFSEAFITQEATSLPENTSLSASNNRTLLYYAQSGDWLPAVSVRFGVDVNLAQGSPSNGIA
jgi:hypothetical protein